MLQSFLIQDDDIALEDDEEYELDIVVSSVTDNVIAGDSADLTITDDDSKLCPWQCVYCTFDPLERVCIL